MFLNGDSCQEAFNDIPSFPEKFYTFGTRGMDEPYNVPLPFRFIGRTYRIVA